MIGRILLIALALAAATPAHPAQLDDARQAVRVCAAGAQVGELKRSCHGQLHGFMTACVAALPPEQTLVDNLMSCQQSLIGLLSDWINNR
jgi:hypothetical protein